MNREPSSDANLFRETRAPLGDVAVPPPAEKPLPPPAKKKPPKVRVEMSTAEPPAPEPEPKQSRRYQRTAHDPWTGAERTVWSDEPLDILERTELEAYRLSEKWAKR